MNSFYIFGEASIGKIPYNIQFKFNTNCKLIDEKICNRTKIKHEVLDSFKNKNSDWYISAPEALKLRIVDEIIQS